jgi:hypothetical protein
VFKIAKSAFTFCLLIGLQSACLDEPDCYALNNNYVGITFKDVATNSSVSVDDVVVLSDTKLIIDTTTTSGVVIPLNYFLQSTDYTISAADTVYHITLGYKSQSQFVSNECGVRFVVSELSVISHDFDSVRLVNAVPGDGGDARNIEIFW